MESSEIGVDLLEEEGIELVDLFCLSGDGGGGVDAGYEEERGLKERIGRIRLSHGEEGLGNAE